MGSDRVKELLSEALQKDADPDVRAVAATVLGNVGATSHGDVLVKAADDKHKVVRRSAVRSLGRLSAAGETHSAALLVSPFRFGWDENFHANRRYSSRLERANSQSKAGILRLH